LPNPFGAHSSRPQISGLALYRAPLLSGEAGTKQTIALMRRLIDDAVSNSRFVRFAKDLVRNVLPYNDIGEAQAVYEFVRQSIRYTKDPVTKETLYPPMELLKIRAGDCDDIAMLMGAIMIALGYPARLVTISANASDPNEFSHVYLESEVPPGSGQWVAMDAARSGAQFGLEPPIYYRKRAWSLTDNSYQDLSGCGCGGCCTNCRAVGRGKFSGLAGVATVGMGDMGQDGVDWSQILQTTIQETPAIIAAAGGQPSLYRTPQGTQVATGPYASYVTPYTPGYGVPQAGYGPVTSGTFTADWPMILLFGLGALLLFGGGRR
jgi:Transglutaminase-like superfamily